MPVFLLACIVSCAEMRGGCTCDIYGYVNVFYCIDISVKIRGVSSMTLNSCEEMGWFFCMEGVTLNPLLPRSLFLSIQNYQQGVWVEKKNLHGHSFTCTAIQLLVAETSATLRIYKLGNVPWPAKQISDELSKSQSWGVGYRTPVGGGGCQLKLLCRVSC